MNDLNDQTISEQAINEFKEAFNIFDKDKDGYITIKELDQIMKKLGQAPTESELQNMINEVDIDGNGTIDFREFLGIMTKKLKETDSEDELIEVFKIFDSDGNGLINSNELLNVMVTLGEDINKEDINDLIKEVDHDGDGFINFEELYEFFKGNSHGITQFIKIIFELIFIVFFKEDINILLLFIFDVIFFDIFIIFSAIKLKVLFIFL